MQAPYAIREWLKRRGILRQLEQKAGQYAVNPIALPLHGKKQSFIGYIVPADIGEAAPLQLWLSAL